MSARREKRLRKLEARNAYLEARVYALERKKLDIEDLGERIEALEKIAANPVMVMCDPSKDMAPRSPSILDRLRLRLKLWKFKRAYMRPGVTREEVERAFKSWQECGGIEGLKKNPPRPFS